MWITRRADVERQIRAAVESLGGKPFGFRDVRASVRAAGYKIAPSTLSIFLADMANRRDCLEFVRRGLPANLYRAR